MNHETDAGHRRSDAWKAVVAVPVSLFMPFLVLWRTLCGIWADHATRGILISAGWLLAVGTLIFCFITLATIGYGDFSPSTELSRLVTVAYGIVGLGIMAALVSTIAAQRLSAQRLSAQRLSAQRAEVSDVGSPGNDGQDRADV